VAVINRFVSKGDLIMPPIRPELLDELLKDYKKPDDLLGQDGLLQQLTKALVERALDGELTHHRVRCFSFLRGERWKLRL
jgi:hypothetical protein